MMIHFIEVRTTKYHGKRTKVKGQMKQSTKTTSKRKIEEGKGKSKVNSPKAKPTDIGSVPKTT